MASINKYGLCVAVLNRNTKIYKQKILNLEEIWL